MKRSPDCCDSLEAGPDPRPRPRPGPRARDDGLVGVDALGAGPVTERGELAL